MKPIMELNDWELLPARRDGERHLHGAVTGHPFFQDGDLIRTTPVVRQWETEHDRYAETRNTIYRLGTPR